MKKATLLFAVTLTLATVIPAEASTPTTISASPASSTVGQSVTFTAAFTSTCVSGFTHYFTIDGKTYHSLLVKNGSSFTEKLSISSLAAGKHTVKYYWYVNASCTGSATISYTVAAPAPPPTPTPSPSPTPTPTPLPSPTPVAVVDTASSGNNQLLGYLGGGLIVLTVISGIALAVFGRR